MVVAVVAVIVIAIIIIIKSFSLDFRDWNSLIQCSSYKLRATFIIQRTNSVIVHIIIIMKVKSSKFRVSFIEVQ